MHRHTILFLILALVSISFAQNRNITIAVVKDGFSAEEQLVGEIETAFAPTGRGFRQRAQAEENRRTDAQLRGEFPPIF